MDQIIIYPQDNGFIALVSPAAECGLSIEEIARKDVPVGKPYKILNSSEIPQDHTFFNAWEYDFTENDGVGIGPEAWFAEQNSLNEGS